jgi:threonyl-tRNA synthetase
MITNLEDGTITFCDHDTLPIYVAVDISRIPESSKDENHECCRSLLAGDEKKQTVNRVYGTSFQTKDLTEYFIIEEAKRAITEN